MKGMEQELKRPDYSPRKFDRTSSAFNCFLAATGVTLMTVCLLGSAVATSIWALVHLLGLPDSVLYVVLALAAIPVGGITIWTAGRAWYLEKRLVSGLDVDAPVFKVFHYFRK